MDLIDQLKEILVDRHDLVEALESLIGEEEESIAGQKEAITILEGRVAGYEETLENASKTLETSQVESNQLKAQLAQAAEKYRQAILSAAPELPSELLTGSTIEEIDMSLENARKVVQKVKERFEQQVKDNKVPVGTPPRGEPDLSAMSAREKIAYGLRQPIPQPQG